MCRRWSVRSNLLRADIHRREVDLQAIGVNSYREPGFLPGGGHDSRYPELLIVVDEFRMLIDSMPDAMAELMRIAPRLVARWVCIWCW